jgi:hypothetical protein
VLEPAHGDIKKDALDAGLCDGARLGEAAHVYDR